MSYRELDRDGMQFSFPTASPAQFDPPALQRTIERILALAEGVRQRWRLSEDELRGVFALDVELNAQGLEAWLDATARNAVRSKSAFPSEKR